MNTCPDCALELYEDAGKKICPGCGKSDLEFKLQTARKALEIIRDTPIKYWMDKKGFADGEPTNCQEVASKALEEIE